MNLRLGSKIIQIFLRTQVQLLGSLVLALVIILIEYGAIIIHAVESGSAVPVGDTGKTVSSHVLGFLRYLSNLQNADNIFTGLFWAVVAVLLYYAFITISNIIISIRNEVVVDVNYSKGSVAKVLFARFGSKILAVCAFVALLAASIFVLVPFWMDLIGNFVFSGLHLADIPLLLTGYLGLAVNIYVVWSAAYFTWIYEESVY